MNREDDYDKLTTRVAGGRALESLDRASKLRADDPAQAACYLTEALAWATLAHVVVLDEAP